MSTAESSGSVSKSISFIKSILLNNPGSISFPSSLQRFLRGGGAPGKNASHVLRRAAAVLSAILLLCPVLSAQQSPDTLDIRRSALSPLEFVATNTGIFGYDP